MDYLIQLHNVPHEIQFYVEELRPYGEITRHVASLPLFVYISSEWDKDILENATGVKKVWEKKYVNTPLSALYGRNWTELLGTKHEND
jgi:hypothetical protein